MVPDERQGIFQNQIDPIATHGSHGHDRGCSLFLFSGFRHLAHDSSNGYLESIIGDVDWHDPDSCIACNGHSRMAGNASPEWPGMVFVFEYIANLMYAGFIRKFSNRLLGVLVLVSGVALIHLAVTSPDGDVIGGWSIDPVQLRIGFTRLMFPFLQGC